MACLRDKVAACNCTSTCCDFIARWSRATKSRDKIADVTSALEIIKQNFVILRFCRCEHLTGVENFTLKIPVVGEISPRIFWGKLFSASCSSPGRALGSVCVLCMCLCAFADNFCTKPYIMNDLDLICWFTLIPTRLHVNRRSKFTAVRRTQLQVVWREIRLWPRQLNMKNGKFQFRRCPNVSIELWLMQQ